MGMRTSRVVGIAAAAVLATASIGVTPASAHHWHHSNAAVAGAVLGMFGTIAALAAADNYYDYYGGPYYYGAPYYYGGPAYYGPRYRYRSRGWHHHWHHRHWHHH